jgi:hypothetical protein
MAAFGATSPFVRKEAARRDPETLAKDVAEGMVSAPNPPMPPAFATALARLAGHAPAIGACNIGIRSPKRWQNRAARSRAPRLGELVLG